MASLFTEKLAAAPATVGTTAISVVGGTASGVVTAGVSYGKGYIGGVKGVIDELLGIGGGEEKVFDKNLIETSWGKLHEGLIANIQPCDPRTGEYVDIDGVPIGGAGKEAGEVTVFDELGSSIDILISNVQIEYQSNWQSPFENAGAESKLPSFMALIQSGEASAYLNLIQGGINAVASGVNKALGKDINVGAIGDLAKSAQQTSDKLIGRTGMTKLNSRQVFSGAPPVRITMTVHFRAIKDAFKEVEKPYEILCDLQAPVNLAENGSTIEAVKGVKSGDYISALFPSQAPQTIAFRYAGKRYAPMVIESISSLLDDPKTVDSNRQGQLMTIQKTAQMTISTMTALDRADLKRQRTFT